MPLRRLLVTGREGEADVALLGPRQRKQTGAQAGFEPRDVDFGAPAMLVPEPCFRQQFAQVQVATMVPHQQEEPRGLVAVVGIRDPDVAAGDGLDPFAAGLVVEADKTECVAEVGQRERALTVFGSRRDDIVETHDAVGNREFGVNTEVDEAGIWHRRHCIVAPAVCDPEPVRLRNAGHPARGNRLPRTGRPAGYRLPGSLMDNTASGPCRQGVRPRHRAGRHLIHTPGHPLPVEPS